MGPNGIGKSNLLDALRFLADIARPGGGICSALQARGCLDKIKFFPAKKKELVEIEIPNPRYSSRISFLPASEMW